MRPTFVHVLTGLLLGTALAGLLNVPGQVVAHQESIPPVRTPNVARPVSEPVVRVSPRVEAAIAAEARKARQPSRSAPRRVSVLPPPVVVRAAVPVTTAPPQRSVAPKPVANEKPDPTPSPAPPTPPPAPQPLPPPPPPAPPTKVVLATPPSTGKKPKKPKKAKKQKKEKHKGEPSRGKSEEVHGKGHDGDHGNDEEHAKNKGPNEGGGQGNGNGPDKDKSK
jgi:hypothetical protein